MDEIITLENYSDSIVIFHMKDSNYKNTFTEKFIRAMIDKLSYLQADRKYKVIILKGLSDIFCAGAAKSELMKLFKEEINVKDLVLSELLLQIPVPVIAAMEGGAVGGGFVIGLCADIIIMAERSMYGGGFTDLGFTPGMGFTRLLQALVGEYTANEMMYTGCLYKGKRFKETGLINHVLPKNKVMQKAINLAEIISEKPRKTLETLKYSISLKKRQVLMEARVHEDFMHKITFNQSDVKNIIEKMYAGPI